MLTFPSANMLALNDASNNTTDYFLSGSLFTPLGTSVMARVIMRQQNKLLSTFKKYSSAGNFTLNVSISNRLISGYQQTQSASVMILDGIAGLSFVPRIAYCQLSVACFLDSSVLSGSGISYYWSIENSTLNTTSPSVSYTFTLNGYYAVGLIAENLVSSAVYSLNVLVTDRLIGLGFHAGGSMQSASVIGQSAPFLFYLMSGAGYTCDVSFGDGSAMLTFSDQPYNLNGTIINHSYASTEAVYSVYVVCWNSINSLNLSFSHFTQYALTGLRLVSQGVSLNTPYSVDFLVAAGSSPHDLKYFVNGVLDAAITPSRLR
jgi:PKD repeat protein